MLPGSLQALTFGYRLNQSSHGDDAVQPAVGVPCCQRPADINLWLQDRLELERRRAAEQPAVVDLRLQVLPELSQFPQMLTCGDCFQPEFEACHAPELQVRILATSLSRACAVQSCCAVSGH